MQIGIVGLPFSGKSTLYQTITKTHLDPAELTKAESHQSVIKVPDERLDKLTEMFNPKKKVNATIQTKFLPKQVKNSIALYRSKHGKMSAHHRNTPQSGSQSR